MERGVLTGEQCGPAGEAGHRSGVVTMEFQTTSRAETPARSVGSSGRP